MEAYVLSFMKMALWILVKVLSLTLDPSHPPEHDTAISKGLKGLGISISGFDTFILNFHGLPSMPPTAGRTGLDPTV